MRAYCTTCWAEVSADERRCPECGAGQLDDLRTFDQKLVAALDHPLPETRVRICWLAGRRKMRDAVPGLLRLLGDPDLYVRVSVLDALGEIGEKATIPAVESVARERSVLIQRAALKALRRIRARSAEGATPS